MIKSELIKIFSYNFLFQTGYIVLSRFDKVVIWLSALLVILGVCTTIASMISRNRLLKVLLGKWSALYYTIGLLGLIWGALRYESVATISARIVVVAIYIIAAIWKIQILRFWFSDYTKMKEEERQRTLREKYL